MIVEMVNTGSELMLGRVLNSHQQWLCRRLSDLGYVVTRQIAVPDMAPEIELAVRDSLSRADLVLTTGGLGPTTDDLTREVIARLLSRALREDAEILAQIQAFFAGRNRPMPEQARVQALVPEGASVLPNPHGTAPGLVLHVNPNPFRNGGKESWLILLPGPGRELRPMFTDSVVPFLLRALPLSDSFVCRTLRTTGIAESIVQERIEGSLRELVLSGLDVGYCARPGCSSPSPTGLRHIRNRRREPGGSGRSSIGRAQENPRSRRILHRRLHRAPVDECLRSLGRFPGRLGDI